MNVRKGSDLPRLARGYFLKKSGEFSCSSSRVEFNMIIVPLSQVYFLVGSWIYRFFLSLIVFLQVCLPLEGLDDLFANNRRRKSSMLIMCTR